MIKDFKKALDLVETKYFALDLIVKDYSPEKLAEIAEKEGLGAQLGFVSEVFYLGSEDLSIIDRDIDRDKLLQLYKLLENSSYHWKFLHSNLPDYGKEIVRQSEKNELNQKWKLYSNLSSSEAEDWIDVYKYWIRKYINATI